MGKPDLLIIENIFTITYQIKCANKNIFYLILFFYHYGNVKRLGLAVWLAGYFLNECECVAVVAIIGIKLFEHQLICRYNNDL